MHLFRRNDKKGKDTADLKGQNDSPEGFAVDSVATSKGTNETYNVQSVDFDKRVKEEAKRLRQTENILSAPHLQRVNDALRLNETKLANVEENLMRTREQRDRLRRFKELQGELELQRAHLFEVNKLQASMLTEKKELDRFETFESVQGRFQRLQILELQRREEKQRESALAGAIDVLYKEMNDEQKLFSQCADATTDSEGQLRNGQDSIHVSLRLEGQNTSYEYIRQKALEYNSQLNGRRNAIEKELDEQNQTIDSLSSEIDRIQTRLQSTEAHQRMVDHSELLVDLLGRMHDMLEMISSTEQKMRDAERRQRSGNDLLGRVFSEYQQIEAQIKTVSDELQVHRQNILGQDSYQLQERAMRLKRRRQMLKSAQALWRNIHKTYGIIEIKQQDINTLRLHQDHVASSVSKLEEELGNLKRNYREKEYTFTLSKSQNVIQLRGDLKEGVSCTVCGATHHPYHSDTMLEQNKLIGELKTEVEMLQAEVRNKEAELLELQRDLECTRTSKRRAEDELITLREIQNEAVKDWAMYTELDSSFQSCDSSTNAEARTAMLRQLIENIEGDVRNAQEELDTYNFHQGRINELSEKMGRYEQTRGELTTRMNEINTSCQVVVREVEWLSVRKQELDSDYARLFEDVDKYITLTDWQNSLTHSYEGMLMQIQDLTAERRRLNAEVKDDKEKLELLRESARHTEGILAELNAQQQIILSTIADCEDLVSENNKEMEKLLDGKSPEMFSENLVGEYLACRKKLEDQRQVYESKKDEYLLAKGRAEELDQTSRKTDSMSAGERSVLDVWIRQYNAGHSPVQYGELANFFEQECDWPLIREKIRKTDMDSLLTQARVDQLRSQMVALQAEGNIPDGDASQALVALAKQEEVLEKRRMDAMLQIATNTLMLQAHEKAESQMKNEKMKETPFGESV